MLLTQVMVLGLALAAADAPKSDPEPAGPLKVRKLKNELPRVTADGRALKDVTTFASQAELEKAFGKAPAAKVAKQVKFPNEVVVRIAYQAEGSSIPELEHEIDKKMRQVTFFFKYPPGARDSVLTLGVALYAVPKGTTVKYIGEKK
jgi:hypothetical protein